MPPAPLQIEVTFYIGFINKYSVFSDLTIEMKSKYAIHPNDIRFKRHFLSPFIILDQAQLTRGHEDYLWLLL